MKSPCIKAAVAASLFLNAALFSGAALAQTQMRISTALAKNTHYGIAIDVFAEEVEKRSNGRYKIQTYYANALGAEREAIEAVQLGTQELTYVSTGALPSFVPDVKIVDVPFLFRDSAHARSVLDGQIGQEMLQKFDARGLKALAWGENGFRHMTNNVRPIRSPSDLQGLKMRTMENPVHIQAYKAFGILPTPMGFSEVFMALQQGVVDGQENPLTVITTSKFEQVQKYLSLTGHVYTPTVFLMNKEAFDKLSDADRKIFLDAAKSGVKAGRERVDVEEKKAVNYLREHGMQVVDDVDRAQFLDALKPVYAEFEKQFGKANLDRIRNVQ